MLPSSDDLIELEMLAMAHGGHALGRAENKTVFVPYTIPGEIVRAKITQDKGRVAFAEGVTLVEASADRVFPRCPHFGPHRCGACHWQHIDYAAQTLLKQDVLADQLDRVGGFPDADVRDIVPSPVEWSYRYTMTYFKGDGGLWGFPSTDPGRIMPIDECYIIRPELLELFERVDFDAPELGRMTLQIGTDDELMLILYVEQEEDVPELLSDLKASVNLILPDNEPINLIGQTHSRFTVKGRTFRITAGTSFYPNIAALDRLIDTVIELASVGTEASVLDLYGGAGFFSAFLAPHVGVVTLVESYPPAANDAEGNLADFDNVDILEGTVEDVLESLDEAETRYAAAILDPPNEGLSLQAVDALGASGIPRLIYVSGDPATLARDAKRLVAHGYTLGAVYPFDLDPQTYYVSAVAVLERPMP